MIGSIYSGLFLIGFILLCVLLGLLPIAVSSYGTYLSFKNKWYIGAASLLIPGFALIVGSYKLITKKDLLR